MRPVLALLLLTSVAFAAPPNIVNILADDLVWGTLRGTHEVKLGISVIQK